MSPKKHILRELTEHAHFRPSDLPGYAGAPERYQAAVNELLRARLIEGRPDADGRMTIALNPQRLTEVHRVLRPIWARPTVWLAAAIATALGAGIVL
jgi:hypothetical protein